MNNNGKDKPKTQDLLDVATKILTQKADAELGDAIFEMCKMQLNAYNNFIALGCNPQQANKHTLTYMEAMMRSCQRPGREGVEPSE